jgi:hypothetical protein
LVDKKIKSQKCPCISKEKLSIIIEINSKL